MREADEAFQGTGRFRVLGRLGGGGGGVVFRAVDRSMGRPVALKLLRDPKSEHARRLRESFGPLRVLAHPNLVRLYDLVEDGGRTFLVMELVEGVGLLDFVRPGGADFDEARLRACFLQLAQGLRALHRGRRGHRDVKPSNVRVTREGRVVLLDMDSSLDLDAAASGQELDSQVRPVGTAAYMAPEQAASRELEPASDWYAFGVVLYEALTGELPYRGTDLEMLLAKQDGRAAPPRAQVAAVPADLDALCTELLAVDPAQRPSGAEVLHRLGAFEEALSGRFSLLSLTATAEALVGREREMDVLMRALERSRRGAHVVRVRGAPGLGKTALCGEFLRRLEAHPERVLCLRASCPKHPDRPHAALHEPLARAAEALRQQRAELPTSFDADVLRWLERAFPQSVLGLEAAQDRPGSGVPDPLEQRFRVVASLRVLLGELARPAPLVFWVDDYHWADADTQRLMNALVRGSDAPAMLLVLSEEPESELATRAGLSAHDVLTLRELDADDAVALARYALTHAAFAKRIPPEEFAREGSPLFIRERLRYASFHGHLPDPNASLVQLMEQRVQELTPAARGVLEIVCTSHDPLPLDVVEAASGMPRAAFARALAALELGGFVRRTQQGSEGWLVCDHALLADAVDLSLQGERRVGAHRKLAAALLSRDPVRASGRLLRHQGESGDHGAAAQSARVAAEQAQDGLAFQRAAELFSLAASLDPPRDDEEGHRNLHRMAEALGHAGWGVQAAAIYRQAAQDAPAPEALRMRQRAAAHLLYAGVVPEGLEALEELLSSIQVTMPKTAASKLWALVGSRARLYLRRLRFQELEVGQVSAAALGRVDALWTAARLLIMVDVARGADFLTRSLLEAIKLGEPRRIARGLCSEAWIRGLQPNGQASAASLIATASALHERHGGHEVAGHLHLARGAAALSAHFPALCYAECAQAERVFRDHCTEVAWEITVAQVYRVLSLLFRARFAEQADALAVALREAEERGDTWGHAYFSALSALGSTLADDRPEEAAEQVREVRARWADPESLHFPQMFAALAEVTIDLYRGEGEALAKLEQPFRAAERVSLLRMPFARVAFYDLRARAAMQAARLRNDTSQLKAAEADARVLKRLGGEVALGLAQLASANVAQLRGERAKAQQALRSGLERLEPHDLGLWVLPARWALSKLEGPESQPELPALVAASGVRAVERWCGMLMPGFV